MPHFSELSSEAQTAIVDAVMGNLPASLPDSVRAEIKAWAETDDFAGRAKPDATEPLPLQVCGDCGKPCDGKLRQYGYPQCYPCHKADADFDRDGA